MKQPSNDETALDAANKVRDNLRNRVASLIASIGEAQQKIVVRDARIAGLEKSAAEDSKARAALEARCAAAEHDAGVWKRRFHGLLQGQDGE